MTTAAKKLQSTPMAPYMNVMKNLNIEEMHIVVEFMNETIHEVEEAKRKAEDEFLERKIAELGVELPESLLKLRGMGHFSQEEINSDDRLAYILSK